MKTTQSCLSTESGGCNTLYTLLYTQHNFLLWVVYMESQVLFFNRPMPAKRTLHISFGVKMTRGTYLAQKCWIMTEKRERERVTCKRRDDQAFGNRKTACVLLQAISSLKIYSALRENSAMDLCGMKQCVCKACNEQCATFHDTFLFRSEL